MSGQKILDGLHEAIAYARVDAQPDLLSIAAKAIIDKVPYGYGMTYSEALTYAKAVMAICADVADAVADEQDVLALSADESNFAGYRQGERVAKQIADLIREALGATP